MYLRVRTDVGSSPSSVHALSARSLSIVRILLASLLLLLTAATIHADEPEKDQPEADLCAFDPNWLIHPQPLDEVAASGKTPDGKPDSTFCDFYRFSWQNFLFLISPRSASSTSGNAYPARFLDQKHFPAFVSDQNPCVDGAPAHTFFRAMPTSEKPRLLRSLDHGKEGEGADIYQAGSRAVIYDQAGRAAIYSMRFSQNMCNLEEILPHPYFPAGTTELKMAWKILEEKDDASLYYTIEAPPGSLGDTKTHTLGLIGFHIAIVTAAHPEMIWITLEHNRNNPLCDGQSRFKGKSVASHPWSFTSEPCAENPESCTFNGPQTFEKEQVAPSIGDPTEICQVYPYGQLPDTVDPVDNDNPANQAAIAQLYQGFLANLSEADWAEVWSNYRIVGSLWLSQPYHAFPRLHPADFNSTDGYKRGNPGDGTYQRGSLALANSVAETDFQGPVDKLNEEHLSTLRNCFGCHGFETNTTDMVLPILRTKTPTYGAETQTKLTAGTGKVSHIFDKIMAEQCKVAEIFYPNSGKNLDLDDPDAITRRCREACGFTGGAYPLWTGKFFSLSNGKEFKCECCTSTAR